MEAARRDDHALMHHISVMPDLYYFAMNADDVFTELRGDVFGVLGYHAEELLGSDGKCLVVPELLPSLLAKHRDVCADASNSIRTEFTYLRKDKTHVKIVSCCTRHEDGSCSGIARYMSEAENPTSVSSMTTPSSHGLIDAPHIAPIDATARAEDAVSKASSASNTTSSDSEHISVDAMRVAYIEDSRSTRKIFERGARKISWIDSCLVKGETHTEALDFPRLIVSEAVEVALFDLSLVYEEGVILGTDLIIEARKLGFSGTAILRSTASSLDDINWKKTADGLLPKETPLLSPQFYAKLKRIIKARSKKLRTLKPTPQFCAERLEWSSSDVCYEYYHDCQEELRSCLAKLHGASCDIDVCHRLLQNIGGVALHVGLVRLSKMATRMQTERVTRERLTDDLPRLETACDEGLLLLKAHLDSAVNVLDSSELLRPLARSVNGSAPNRTSSPSRPSYPLTPVNRILMMSPTSSFYTCVYLPVPRGISVPAIMGLKMRSIQRRAERRGYHRHVGSDTSHDTTISERSDHSIPPDDDRCRYLGGIDGVRRWVGSRCSVTDR